jgi:Zn-dependent protease
MNTQRILEILLFMPGFLFSLSFHEASHAFVAFKLGDSTAKSRGRISLSPIPHADILGTIILPILGLYFGGFVFGWGKPVPVDYRNLKNVRRDAMLISAAGPASNLFLAIIFSLVIRLYHMFLPSLSGSFIPDYNLVVIQNVFVQYMFLNLALCFFNLIPIDPLDGGKILSGLLPRDMAMRVEMFTMRYGGIILILLFFTGLLGVILSPIIRFVAGILLM